MTLDFRRDQGVRASMTCHYANSGAVALGESWTRYREVVSTSAVGDVLEIGVHDLTDPTSRRLPHFLAVTRDFRDGAGMSAGETTDAEGPHLPYPDAAFDIIVCTFSLCVTAHPRAAMREVGRVLRPTGHLRFLEHVRAPGIFGTAQDRVRAMFVEGGRCRPNVEALQVLQGSGLVVRRLEWFWPPTTVYAPVVQGVAAHPDRQYERELGWLRGA